MAALRTVLAEIALASLAQPAGTYVSGPIANPGYALWVDAMVHLSVIAGGAPTLDARLESSPDNITWTMIPGTAITQLVAAGSARCSGRVNNEYVRVSTTVGGTGTATYGAAAVVIPV